MESGLSNLHIALGNHSYLWSCFHSSRSATALSSFPFPFRLSKFQEGGVTRMFVLCIESAFSVFCYDKRWCQCLCASTVFCLYRLDLQAQFSFFPPCSHRAEAVFLIYTFVSVVLCVLPQHLSLHRKELDRKRRRAPDLKLHKRQLRYLFKSLGLHLGKRRNS